MNGKVQLKWMESLKVKHYSKRHTAVCYTYLKNLTISLLLHFRNEIRSTIMKDNLLNIKDILISGINCPNNSPLLDKIQTMCNLGIQNLSLE